MAAKNTKKISIPVFKAEREAGIAKIVQSNASIAYVTQLQDSKLSQEVAHTFLQSVSANADLDQEQFDLFYLNTILVTTGCNKNFDVFTKSPTWAARYSPVHKQFNLEHDQSKIIGHMTTAKAVDENFNPIADDASIDDVPDKFHILTGAVIYRVLSDEKAQEDIDRIIEEIADNQWYVSMECLFRGFDYAAIASNGEQRVIPRNEETAWLTKHLRQYGGSGEYNGYTLGRVLNNITFSGKGLVRKPANPDSIIFNENVKAFHTVYANLGYILNNDNSDSNNLTLGNISMPNDTDTDTNKNKDGDKVTALEKLLEQARSEIKTLSEQVKTHESSATTAKITSLESDLKAKSDKVIQLEAELKTLTDTKSDLETKLKASEDRAVKAEKEVADAKAAEQTRARVEKLTKIHAPEAEAKQVVALFNDKNDEQFDAIVSLFSSKWKAPTTSTPENSTATTTAAAPAAKTNLSAGDVEPEPDAALAAGSNVEVEKTRAALSSLFDAYLHGPDLTSSEDGNE